MSDLDVLLCMGFPKEKAETALSITGNNGIEAALDWLTVNYDASQQSFEGQSKTIGPTQDEEPKPQETSVNQPQPASAADHSTEQCKDAAGSSPPDASDQIAKSIKCDDCGKVFRSVDEAEFHAVKSQHSNFSESSEEKKPLTEEEKANQLTKLKQIMAERRQKREDTERKDAIERERKIRESGRMASSIKKDMMEKEAKLLRDDITREKREAKLAKQRIKEQIERDKLERQQKFPKHADTAASPQKSPDNTTPTQASTQSSSKTYDEARIQLRFPDSSTLVHTFKSKESLAAIRLFVQLNRKDSSTTPFSLTTTYPRKVFTEADMEKPLDELGLVPSAALVVQMHQQQTT